MNLRSTPTEKIDEMIFQAKRLEQFPGHSNEMDQVKQHCSAAYKAMAQMNQLIKQAKEKSPSDSMDAINLLQAETQLKISKAEMVLCDSSLNVLENKINSKEKGR